MDFIVLYVVVVMMMVVAAVSRMIITTVTGGALVIVCGRCRPQTVFVFIEVEKSVVVFVGVQQKIIDNV